MSIDESAGVLARRDRIARSSKQSQVLACLLDGRGVPSYPYPTRTLRALSRRGWIEQSAGRWRLTDAGREAARSSPAVAEWIDGWAKYQAT